MNDGGLEHALDGSDLMAVPSLSGREYRRIYFNVVASRWPLRRLPGLRLEFPERYLAASVGRAGAEFEIHVAHLPPGSTRGLIKVEMFEALHARLATRCERPRILCGALRVPNATTARSSSGANITRRAPNAGTKPNAAWCSGLGDYDLPDVFRTLNGYTATDTSWVARAAASRGAVATTTSSPPGA